MEHGRIIKRAMDITLRNKVLWIFGVAAALFGGLSGGGGGGGGRGIRSVMGNREWPGQTPFGHGSPGGPFGQMMPDMPWETIVPVVIAVLGALFILWVIWMVLSVIVRYTSLGALIGMVDEIEEQEETGFRQGLRRGWRRILHLLAINIVVGLGKAVLAFATFFVVLVGLAAAAIPAVLLFRLSDGAGVAGILVGVAVGLVVALVAIAFAIIINVAATLAREYSFRASVLAETNILSAIGVGLGLAKHNLRDSFLMWLFLAVIRMALGVVMIPLVLIGVGIMVGPALGMYGLTESAGVAIVSALPGLIIMIAGGAFLGGLLLTFQSAAWTLTFRELRVSEMTADAM